MKRDDWETKKKSIVLDLDTTIVKKGDRKGWNLTGATLVHICFAKGDLPTVRFLTDYSERQKRTDAMLKKDSEGKTSFLYAAVFNKSVDVIQFLLNFFEKTKPGFIFEVDGNGWTALHYAAERKTIEVFKYLANIFESKKPGFIYKKDNLQRTVLHHAAVNDDVGVFKYLIKSMNEHRKPDFVFHTDTLGRNLLHLAAFYNPSVDVTRYLLQFFKDSAKPEIIFQKDNEGQNILQFAVQNNPSVDVIKCLVEYIEASTKPEIIFQTNANGYTILHLAACNRSVDVTEYVLQYIQDSEKPEIIFQTGTKDNNNILQLAVMNSPSADVIKCLVEYIEASTKPEIIFQTDARGSTILHLAAQYNPSADVTKFLLHHLQDTEKPEIIFQTDNQGSNILQFAVRDNPNVDVIKCLLEYIETSNKPEMIFQTTTSNGDTILHFAAMKNPSADVVKYLLQYIQDSDMLEMIFQTDNYGSNILQLAVMINPSVDVIKCLVEYIQASTKPDIILQTNAHGHTILHLAAGKNPSVDVTKYLLQYIQGSAKPEMIFQTDNDGNDILQLAVRKNPSVGVIKCLVEYIEASTKPEIILNTTAEGETILHLALYNENIVVLEYLTDYFVRRDRHDFIYQQDNFVGVTPLDEAILKGKTGHAKLLTRRFRTPDVLDEGSTPNPKHKGFEDADHVLANTGMTPLHAAAYEGNYEMLDHLVDLGVELDLQNGQHMTALQVAVHLKHFECAELLLRMGADPSLRDKDTGEIEEVWKIPNEAIRLQDRKRDDESEFRYAVRKKLLRSVFSARSTMYPSVFEKLTEDDSETGNPLVVRVFGYTYNTHTLCLCCQFFMFKLFLYVCEVGGRCFQERSTVDYNAFGQLKRPNETDYQFAVRCNLLPSLESSQATVYPSVLRKLTEKDPKASSPLVVLPIF